MRLEAEDFIIKCKYTNSATSKGYEDYPMSKIDPEGNLPVINCKADKTKAAEEFLERTYDEYRRNEPGEDRFTPVKGNKRKNSSSASKEIKRNRKFSPEKAVKK